MKMRPGESKYWIITEKANLGERIYLYIQVSKPEAPSSGKQHTSCSSFEVGNSRLPFEKRVLILNPIILKIYLIAMEVYIFGQISVEILI